MKQKTWDAASGSLKEIVGFISTSALIMTDFASGETALSKWGNAIF